MCVRRDNYLTYLVRLEVIRWPRTELASGSKERDLGRKRIKENVVSFLGLKSPTPAHTSLYI